MGKVMNRRAGPDPLLKVTAVISRFSWVFVIIVAFFSWIFVFFSYMINHVVKEPLNTLFEQQTFTASLSNMIRYHFYIMLILFVAGSIGLTINSLRHHRKTDRYNKSLIMLVILSLFVIIVYLLFL